MAKTKALEAPKFLLEFPDDPNLNPTDFVGREVWVPKRGEIGSIKSVGGDKKYIVIQFPDGREDETHKDNIKLIAYTRWELEEIKKEFQKGLDGIEEKLNFLNEKGVDAFSEREYKALKLLNSLKNEEDEDIQLKMLLNNKGF